MIPLGAKSKSLIMSMNSTIDSLQRPKYRVEQLRAISGKIQAHFKSLEEEQRECKNSHSSKWEAIIEERDDAMRNIQRQFDASLQSNTRTYTFHAKDGYIVLDATVVNKCSDFFRALDSAQWSRTESGTNRDIDVKVLVNAKVL